MNKRILQLTYGLAYAVVLGTVSVPAHATYPGRNGLIAFTAQDNPEAPYQIYTIRPNGKKLRQLTYLDAGATTPDWSADGRRITFQIERNEAPFCSVAIMNSDGTDIVELTPQENICENDPSFTPDGSRIVFDRYDPATNDEALWSMDVTGHDRQRIGSCCADPNVSPDGEKLSFLSFIDQPGGSALFTSDVDGSNLLQLTPFSFDVAIKQDWAPDGQHLVFSKDAYSHFAGVSGNIATIRPDGTHLRFVTNYQGGDVNAFVGSYSPDGRWIVFRLEDHGQFGFGLFKIHPDGTHLKVILPLSNFKPRFIDWGAKPSEDEDKEAEE
jgi:Tol biopolymer transport system component